MALFTCDNCNYTFSSREKPDACPDCGKTVAARRAGGAVPAIRPASESERLWFRRVQAELEQERREAQENAGQQAAQKPA